MSEPEFWFSEEEKRRLGVLQMRMFWRFTAVRFFACFFIFFPLLSKAVRIVWTLRVDVIFSVPYYLHAQSLWSFRVGQILLDYLAEKGSVSLMDFMLLRAGWAGDKCLSSEDLQLMRVSCIPPERET